MIRESVALAATLLVVASARPAAAATSMRTTVSARQVEVGGGIRVELSALSDGDDSPQNPRLKLPPGFSVNGPSVGTNQQISFTNGSFVHRHGITATWVIAGARPGKFTIGPAVVDVGRSSVQGETIEIEIVPQGMAPQQPQQPQRRRLPGMFDPFDPFSGFPKLPGWDDDDDDAPPLLDAPEEPPAEYALPHAPDPIAFLRATVEPRNAVVGQEVRLRVYAYGGRGAWEEVSSSEPSRADFLSQSIVDNSYRQPRVVLRIDDTQWTAAKVRDIALFPLRAGTLTVGSMHMGFRGRAYPETKPLAGLVRESEPISVQVSEPPLAGRPPGYELGDVGSYTLSAEVEPRRIEAGSAVSVTVRIEGSGNVPHRVKVPEASDLDWPDPVVKEAVTPSDRGVSGWRQLRYVLKIDGPGQRDLGEVTLPYWDPARQRYEVARARLGTVEVAPGAQPAAAPSQAAPVTPRKETGDAFSDLAPRASLSKASAPEMPWTDRWLFWALLAGGPLAVVLSRGLGDLGKRVRSRLSARAASPSVLAKKALEGAATAAEKGDAPGVTAGIERAIYTTIEDRLGLRARAVLRSELAHTLEQAGAPRDLAAETVSTLDECERIRFGGAKDAALTAVIGRASGVTARLSRARGARRGEASP